MMIKQTYRISGMNCAACSAHVERAVSRVPGVVSVSVNLLAAKMHVKSEKPLQNEIVAAVTAAGYGAFLLSEKASMAEKENTVPERTQIGRQLLFSLVLLLPVMYLSMSGMHHFPLPPFSAGNEEVLSFSLLQFLLSLPILWLNRSFFVRGFRALFSGGATMDTLIAIGSGAAMGYSTVLLFIIGHLIGQGQIEAAVAYRAQLYFESADMILVLISFGRWLEAISKSRTGDALQKLMSYTPQTALIRRDGTEITVNAELLVPGDTVIVKAGMRIPCDGTVTEGSGSVDESAMTGESLPVEKLPGSTVLSSTMAQSGYFVFIAEKTGETTSFSQMLQLVEDASASKAPIAKTADKVAGIFVPTVMTIALITLLVWVFMGQAFSFALARAVTVLIIACPCALGLATPVAVMVGCGRGAECGILIKGGEALEAAHRINAVMFDKTGTVTQGKPSVSDVFAIGVNEADLLSFAYGLESKSDHPLAQAVCTYARQKDILAVHCNDFSVKAGQGVSGKVGDTLFFAGNEQFIRKQNIVLFHLLPVISKLADEGKTPVIFARNKEVIGIIGIHDAIKPSAREAILQLQNMGISVTMLTGDHEKTANYTAKMLGIKNVRARLLPADKEQAVATLVSQGYSVAMVGDGINDAPALTRADVGIAIGAGTDVAMESADIVLVSGDLSMVVKVIKLSRIVIRIIRENLFWAFFYNCLGIPLAAGVFYPAFGLVLSPSIGAAAMSLSSVFVVLNALRLKRIPLSPQQRKRTEKKKMNETSPISIPETDCKDACPIEFKKNVIEKKKMISFRVNDMMCVHCVKRISDALNSIKGASDVKVELDSKLVSFSCDEATEASIKSIIKNAGYEISEYSES